MGRFFCLICCFSLPFFSLSQGCKYYIYGQIKDKGNHSPLSFATIKLVNGGTKGTIADAKGKFKFKNICAGSYHVQINYQGYKEQKHFIRIQSDTTLTFQIEPHLELLNEVVIHGSEQVPKSQISHVISQHIVHEQSSKNLANILSSTIGVRIIKNGAGIAKPIIHGMYGNRISILNAGLVQSGQQWGNDHAPEIDPFIADHLSVVKGSAALEYGGNSLGGVVLIEEGNIETDPHVHGEGNYIYEANGRGHTTNLMLEQGKPKLKWKTTATYKNFGDKKAPNYYLTNTGKKELNFSVLLEKKIKKWNSKLYYSYFNNIRVGVLAASHVTSATDLIRSFDKEIPFYTKKTFSREIVSPSQSVQHHLAKFELKKNLKHNDWEFVGGFQQNFRREFDIRRGGRSTKPAMKLLLNTLEFKFKNTHKYSDKTLLKSGVHYIYKDNTNISGTGVLPLIPDYLSWKIGAFSIFQKDLGKSFYEFGVRYDFVGNNSYKLEGPLRKTVGHYYHRFHNLSANAGFQYRFTPSLKATTNIGLVTRSPEVNELHSQGLHQGVSALEYGSSNLKPENSIKWLTSLEWLAHQKFTLQAIGYYQFINNYIYLKPNKEPRTTIRGVFNVFNYVPTDLARVAGIDAMFIYRFSSKIRLKATYAMIRGDNLSESEPLIFMPADKADANILLKIPKIRLLERSELIFGGSYIARQNRLSEGEKYLPTSPEGYFLLNAGVKTNFNIKETNFKLFVKAENLLDTRYRDYLNRLRYYADESGRNISIGLNVLF